MRLLVALLICILETAFCSDDIPEICRISHGKFENVTIPSGISTILFTNIPQGSRFGILQLHTPFNPVMVSTLVSFDSQASQSSSHSGLVYVFSGAQENITMFIYSSYEAAVDGWARIDAYDFQYPIPGGCGRYLADGFASAIVTTEIMQMPRNLPTLSNSTYEALSYWTSTLKFTLAGVPDPNTGGYKCSAEDQNTTLIYRVYSKPLVTAGGSSNSYNNPKPYEAASVLNEISSAEDSLGRLIHTFSIKISDSEKMPLFRLPVARRPGTASVVTLVVEYVSASSSARVSYAPTILYGCPSSLPPRGLYGYSYTVQNRSLQLGCAILPTTSPSIYFPVAMLLLGSIFYACCCNFLVWLRCGISVMVTASLIGIIFFYRYSVLTSNAVLLIVVSIFVPGLLALIVFTVLWCVCIRPTLYYQQIFGRGPLMRIIRGQEQPLQFFLREPWNTEFPGQTQSDVGFVSQSPAPFVNTNEPVVTAGVNPLFPVSEEVLSHGPLDSREHLTFEFTRDEEVQNACRRRSPCSHCGFSLLSWARSCHCPVGSTSRRQTQILSLKPRRIARLPPIVPAIFLIVAYLSITFDSYMFLNRSVVAYLCFVVFVSLPLLVVFCVFKNLAFGLSTALVGVYLSLSCICLFLVPNAVLPHIVIEQFLRLTWIEHRLGTLRIEFYGLYDILMMVTWIFGTLVFGFLTLCLIRLQDARELAEAQRSRNFSFQPYAETRSTTALPTTSGSSFWNEVANLSNMSWFLPGRIIPASSAPISTASETAPAAIPQISVEVMETQGPSRLDSVNSSCKAPTELTQLLPGFPRASYGGLAITTQQPLMPLSRVQLAAVNTGRLPGTLFQNFSSLGQQQQHAGSVPSREVEEGPRDPL